MAQLTDLEKVRKRRTRGRTIRGLLTLALFGCVVFFASSVIHEAGDLNLNTALSDIKAEMTSGSGYPVTLPGGRLLRLESAGDALVLLSDTNLYTYSGSGKQMLNVQHGMANQQLKLARDRMLLYDRGGTRAMLLSRSAQVHTLDTDNTIYTADVAANDTFAVATGSEEALVKVVVYNRGGGEIFRWFSAKRPVTDIALSDSRDMMVVGCVDVSDGSYLSGIQKFQFSYQEGNIGEAEIPDELILSLDYRGSGAVRAVTDKSARLYNSDLKETASFSFDGQTLERFADAPDGKLVLVLGSYDKDKQLRIVTLGPGFEVISQFTVDFNIASVRAENDYLFLAGKDRVYLMNYDGTLAAQLQVNNLHQIEPIGGQLYYATNLAVDRVEIRAMTEPEEEASEASKAPEASGASSGGKSAPDGAEQDGSGAEEEESAPEDRKSSAPSAESVSDILIEGSSGKG